MNQARLELVLPSLGMYHKKASKVSELGSTNRKHLLQIFYQHEYAIKHVCVLPLLW